MEINFPAFALFQSVLHKGTKQLQFRPNRKFDGRRMVVIPDRESHQPVEGQRIPIAPGRVLSVNDHMILVTCFVSEQYSENTAFKKKLQVAMRRLGASAPKQSEKPAPAPKPCTGRFVDPNAPTVTANLAAPLEGMKPEFKAAGEKQRKLLSFSGKPVSRGSEVVGAGKIPASSDRTRKKAVAK